jgi:hypothetical protein
MSEGKHTFTTWREFAQLLLEATALPQSQCEPAGTLEFVTYGEKIRHIDIVMDVLPRKLCPQCNHTAHRDKCEETCRDESGEYQCLCPHSDPDGIEGSVWNR